jgi:rRNA processing protein Gar1
MSSTLNSRTAITITTKAGNTKYTHTDKKKKKKRKERKKKKTQKQTASVV